MEISNKTLGKIITVFAMIIFVMLILIKLQFDQEGEFLCELVSQSENYTMDECPAHEGQSTWPVLVGFIIDILMLLCGLYLIFHEKLSIEKKEFKKIDMSELDEDEKKIYSLLKENDGSIYQSSLIEKTDFSKVKITRILDKMETKGIIEKRRHGMTNIVVLK